MYKTPIQIRFNDIDQMGHINNAVIMEYFDLGKSNFFTAAGLPPEQNDFTIIVVHVEVDFHKQILFHDSIAVETHISRYGNKSLEVMQQVVDQNTGDAYATCKTIMSGYCRSTHSSAIIPETVKEQLRSFDEA